MEKTFENFPLKLFLARYPCILSNFTLFQGRGNNTHAYTHSVSEGHRVFLNLESQRFYCLPDNYEVIDASLGDILYVLDPTFSTALIKRYVMHLWLFTYLFRL